MRFSFSSSSPMRTGIGYKSRWGRELSYITDIFCQENNGSEDHPQADPPAPIPVRRSEADLRIGSCRAVDQVTGPYAGDRRRTPLLRRSGGTAKARRVPANPAPQPYLPARMGLNAARPAP